MRDREIDSSRSKIGHIWCGNACRQKLTVRKTDLAVVKVFTKRQDSFGCKDFSGSRRYIFLELA